MDTKQITFLPKTTIISQMSDLTTHRQNTNNRPTPTTDPTLICLVFAENSEPSQMRFAGGIAPKVLIQIPN